MTISNAGDTADTMMREAMPAVARVLSRKFGTRVRVSPYSFFESDNDDALECCSRACASLAAKFIRVAEGTDSTIDSVADYAAIAAKNTFKDYLRERTPARTRFANRVRHALLEDPQFAIWTAMGTDLAGYAEWQSQRKARVAVSEIRSRDAELRADSLLGSDWDQPEGAGWEFTHALLTRVFDVAGGPIELDSLIGYLVEIVGIPSGVHVPPEGRGGDEPVEVPYPDPRGRSPEELAIARDRAVADLERFWTCCIALPRPSLLALMLNLPAVAEAPAEPGTREKKSGSRGEIAILVVRGVASIAAIGRALRLTNSEYARLEAALGIGLAADKPGVDPIYCLWRHLPLKDDVLAHLLERKANQIPKVRERSTAQVRKCMTEKRLTAKRHMAGRSPSVSSVSPAQ